MTDPSYKGQFVCFTHVHIGNTGINFGASARPLEALRLLAAHCQPASGAELSSPLQCSPCHAMKPSSCSRCRSSHSL